MNANASHSILMKRLLLTSFATACLALPALAADNNAAQPVTPPANPSESARPARPQRGPVDRLGAMLGEDVWTRVGGDQPNLMRLFFHPEGVRPLITNWAAVAPLMWRRAQREAEADYGHIHLQLRRSHFGTTPSRLTSGCKARSKFVRPRILNDVSM